ncbi:OapA N-terminal domain-containing protein [Anaerofustis stercorihominis]
MINILPKAHQVFLMLFLYLLLILSQVFYIF